MQRFKVFTVSCVTALVILVASVISLEAQALPPGTPAVQQDIVGIAGCNNSNGHQTTCSVLHDWLDATSPVLVDATTGTTLPWKQVVTQWKTIAQNFDTVVFNTTPTLNGPDASFLDVANSANVNYPQGVDQVGIGSYFAPTATYDPEAITTLGAMVGGTLAGINYRSKAIPGYNGGLPINLVNNAKKWYSTNLGGGQNAQVFLDHAKGGVSQFWYEVTPNVYACQLAALYGSSASSSDPGDPNSPSLMSLCLSAVATWNYETDYLAGNVPGQVPEFAYGEVALVAGPIPGNPSISATKYQPIQVCNMSGLTKFLTPASSPWSGFTFKPKVAQVCIPGFGGTQAGSSSQQSDVAGALAYINLLAYEETGNNIYRTHLDSDLKFFESIQYNPLYEMLLPYGIIAAARMNAEYRTTYNLGKYLDWQFSESGVRYAGYSVHSDNWSGYPMYGVLGQYEYPVLFQQQYPNPIIAKDGEMDALTVSNTIAPVARYQPQYAQAIGKYLVHVATSGLLNYPAFTPYGNPDTRSYIASAGTNGGFDFSTLLQKSIPWEDLCGGAGVTTQPYGSANVLYDPPCQPNGTNHSRTDLAIYMGISAGDMAAMLNQTNVSGIYQIDLLATDVPNTTNAYPTYLLYNPVAAPNAVESESNSRRETRSDRASTNVSFRVEIARDRDARLSGPTPVMLYDLVSKQILADNVTGNTVSITLSHDQAAVIAVVPDASGLQYNATTGGLMSGNVVVDYYYTRTPDPSTEVGPNVPIPPSRP